MAVVIVVSVIAVELIEFQMERMDGVLEYPVEIFADSHWSDIPSVGRQRKGRQISWLV